LGRPDCGQIKVGMRADIAVWATDQIENAGSWDPAALVLAGPQKARDVFVEGRAVVTDGQMVNFELGRVIEQANILAKALA